MKSIKSAMMIDRLRIDLAAENFDKHCSVNLNIETEKIESSIKTQDSKTESKRISVVSQSVEMIDCIHRLADSEIESC